MTTRAAIVAYARSQRNVLWQHQACLPNVALDCLGLIACTGMACNVIGADKWRGDARMRNYNRVPDQRLIAAACDEYLDRIAIVDVDIADILLMRFADAPQHFAIVSSLKPMRIVHAYTTVGRVCETGLGGGWDKRVVRAYRYRGIEPTERTGAELCQAKFGESVAFSGEPRLDGMT